MGDRINRVFFFTRKRTAILPGGQKKGERNIKVTLYYWGGRKAGFHHIIISVWHENHKSLFQENSSVLRIVTTNQKIKNCRAQIVFVNKWVEYFDSDCRFENLRSSCPQSQSKLIVSHQLMVFNFGYWP